MTAPAITVVLPVYWPSMGGCEIHTRALVQALAPGHRIRIVTLIRSNATKGRQYWVDCFKHAPARAEHLPDGDIDVIRIPFPFHEKLAAILLARLQSPKFPRALVHAMMELLTRIVQRRLAPLLDGSSLIHCVHGGASFLGRAALREARRRHIPFLFVPLMHMTDPAWSNVAPNQPRPTVFRPTLELVPRTWTDDFWLELTAQADALITMTEFERQFFIARGRAPATAHTVGVGPIYSESPHEDVRTAFHLGASPFVLFVGRMTAAKGVVELLEAMPAVWQRHPELHIVFAGPGSPSVEGAFARHTDPRIHRVGVVGDHAKSSLLRECLMMCMPSREESLGVTYLEAWMAAKPVIAVPVPPVLELTANGTCGGLVVEPTPAAIADAITTLADNPDRAATLGQQGHTLVLSRYAWPTIAARTAQVYASLLHHDASLL